MLKFTVILFSFFILCRYSFATMPLAESVPEVLIKTNNIIWGFDFIGPSKILFTERSGKLKIFSLKDKSVLNVSGVPKVYAEGQGGLLDVRLHPKEKNKIFLTYSKPMPKGKSTTALYTATLQGHKITHGKDIFIANNPSDKKIHFGSRIVFDDKNHLFVSVGDRNAREKAQDVSAHNGKIIRMQLDGSSPEVWSYGHRNPQGLVFDQKNQRLWEIEFGPRGGDELNLIEKGKNYGWPDVTYGREYWGPKIGVTKKKGTEQPIIWWDPSISPSGMEMQNGNLLVGCLSGTHLRRIVLKNKKVISQEVLLGDWGERIRNVKISPDGQVYISTDSGKLARLIFASKK